MSKNSIISFNSKAIEKLIETVSAGIGTLYRPTATRKEAEAKAYEIEMIAKAEAKALLIETENKFEILQRARDRVLQTEYKRQINIERIADKAVGMIGEFAYAEPIDEDWRTAFFNKAQDVSVDAMQDIWARILSLEVEENNSVSIKTLGVLSCLTKREALLFEKLCKYVSEDKYILHEPSIHKFGISFNDLLVLSSYDLVNISTNIATSFLDVSKDEPAELKYGHGANQVIASFHQKGLSTQIDLPTYVLTSSGEELCRILYVESDLEYVQKVMEELKSRNFIVD